MNGPPLKPVSDVWMHSTWSFARDRVTIRREPTTEALAVAGNLRDLPLGAGIADPVVGAERRLLVDHAHAGGTLGRRPRSAGAARCHGKPRLARAAIRRPAAARSDGHPEQRHIAACGGAYLGLRHRDLRHRLRPDPRSAATRCVRRPGARGTFRHLALTTDGRAG